MTRRQMLQAAGSAVACWSAEFALAQIQPFHNLGGAPAGFPIRSRAARGGNLPFDFLEHCHDLGFGVAELRLDLGSADAVKELRQKLEAYHMRAILDVPLP